MIKPTFSMAEEAIEKLTECIDYAPVEQIKLVRLHHHVALMFDENFSQSLKPLQLNQTEWITLLFLYSTEVKRFSPSELAKSLNCSRTNATRLIESLKKRNFIHCTVNSIDRRKMQISLSQEGRTFFEAHLPRQFENVRKIITGAFTKKEEETFFNLSMKILKYLEKNQ